MVDAAVQGTILNRAFTENFLCFQASTKSNNYLRITTFSDCVPRPRRFAFVGRIDSIYCVLLYKRQD